jgi:hypothetical protein
MSLLNMLRNQLSLKWVEPPLADEFAAFTFEGIAGKCLENLHEFLEICGPDFLEIHHDFVGYTWASLTRPSAEDESNVGFFSCLCMV